VDGTRPGASEFVHRHPRHAREFGPLTPEDTADYVRMRVTRVGGSKELFSSDAVAMLHEAAAGSLRDIDRVASLALRAAGRRRRKTVERDLVARILQSEGERP
jgi:general secretion pathway protein A